MEGGLASREAGSLGQTHSVCHSALLHLPRSPKICLTVSTVAKSTADCDSVCSHEASASMQRHTGSSSSVFVCFINRYWCRNVSQDVPTVKKTNKKNRKILILKHKDCLISFSFYAYMIVISPKTKTCLQPSQVQIRKSSKSSVNRKWKQLYMTH